MDAKSLEEKIKKLEEFISLVPKHKATEKIVALNRTRLVKLKDELESNKKRQKKLSSRISPFSVKSEGIQVILISDYNTPGAGKTTIFHYLTGAKYENIGKFTAIPQLGIYKFNKIKFQIVDMPAIMEGASKGVGHGTEILSAVRSADLICLCIDLSRGIQKQMGLLLSEFSKANIRINITSPPIEIEKTGSNKIQVFYLTEEAKKYLNMDEDIKQLVKESGIHNALVKIHGKINLEMVSDALNQSIAYRKMIILGTKGDLPNTQNQFDLLKKKYKNKFPLIIGVSGKKGEGFIDFGNNILEFLNKIKIFTKSGNKIAEPPLIVNNDSTVKDIALKIHKSFYKYFKYAVVYRKGSIMNKKRVGINYLLQNEDVVEIFTTV